MREITLKFTIHDNGTFDFSCTPDKRQILESFLEAEMAAEKNPFSEDKQHFAEYLAAKALIEIGRCMQKKRDFLNKDKPNLVY